METETDQDATARQEPGHDLEADAADLDEADDSGTGAAVALLVALLTFLIAVAFVILRHVLFQA